MSSLRPLHSTGGGGGGGVIVLRRKSTKEKEENKGKRTMRHLSHSTRSLFPLLAFFLFFLSEYDCDEARQ